MSLESLINSGRFPHAVLILGGTSEQIAQVIAYHKCDVADTVRVRDSMPDGSYKVEPLREAVATGNLRPQFGDTRVFVFEAFDTMSVTCQNTLLKFFEEPNDFTRFVMTAANKSPILSTILSRVVVVDGGAQSDNDADGAQQNSQTAETVAAVMSAVKARNKAQAEYDTAAAFAKIKDRNELERVLQALLLEFAALLPAARRPEKLIEATDVLQKYIRRIEVNPNVSITVTACAAEIHTALHS